MTSRYQATRLQQLASLLRFTLPDLLSGALTLLGLVLTVIAAAMLA